MSEIKKLPVTRARTRKRKLTPGESAFEAQLHALDENVTIGTYAYYSLDAILRKGPKINPLIQQAPYFWATTKHALQLDYLMALSRVVEPRNGRGQLRSKVNFLRLIEILRDHRAIFSKDALRKRVQPRFVGNKNGRENYLKRTSRLTELTILQLERRFDRHATTCGKLMTLRDKVLAHGDITSPQEVKAVFKGIAKRDIEALLAFLNQVQIELWSLYNNGIRPSWKPKTLPEWRHSLADRVHGDVSKFLDRISALNP